MRKEIEIKVRVDSLEPIIQTLTEGGHAIGEPITQKDYVYIAPDVSYEHMNFRDIFLRVRETPHGNYFTLKQMQKNELDNVEEESMISNPESMRNALEIMGYTLAVQVFKTRRAVKCDDLEICLDEVEDLGSFIEVEKITDDSEDAEAVQEELLDFLGQLGIDRKDRVENGYDTLMYFKQKEDAHK